MSWKCEMSRINSGQYSVIIIVYINNITDNMSRYIIIISQVTKYGYGGGRSFRGNIITSIVPLQNQSAVFNGLYTQPIRRNGIRITLNKMVFIVLSSRPLSGLRRCNAIEYTTLLRSE